MSDKLDIIRTKRAQLDARIKKIEAAEKQKARKLDSRKKIVLGASLMAFMRNSSDIEVRKTYYKCLTTMNERDRSLFINQNKSDSI